MDIYCADVGSIKNNNFGWAKISTGCDETKSGTNITDFAINIANSIKSNIPVSLGFECPLFLPVRDDPVRVNGARIGEGNRPWSSGAGVGAMGTGLVEALWVMREINKQLSSPPLATMCWDQFVEGNADVYIWEAFVTASAKGITHSDDALIAVREFVKALPTPEKANAIDETDALSLIGAAGLKTKWFRNISVLSEPCLVVKAI